MDNERNQKRFESVYSTKVRAGKRRTYFFDVRQTKGEDYYLTLTESTRRFNGEGYERHKIFLYKEDFNRFMTGLNDAISYIKTELMPDYDYDEYTRRHEEWEAQRLAQEAEATSATENVTEDLTQELTDDVDSPPPAEKEVESKELESEDDMSW